MLTVLSPNEVLSLIDKEFHRLNKTESIELADALGRVTAEDIVSGEFVPGFNRSSVDGYAVFAGDSFGCSESIPAILKLSGSVEMGLDYGQHLKKATCVYVPTGGKVPNGADAVVMVEYTEQFSSDEIALIRPVSPGENMVFKGDDCEPGQVILRDGTVIRPQHVASLASLGIRTIPVVKKPVAAVISTGDELVSIDEIPKSGQVRDVNSHLLKGLLEEYGCEVQSYGFIKDREDLLRDTIRKAIEESDLVVISGGSSVGQKDATARILSEFCPLLFHGIAMKPGKPTILGNYQGVPLLGLPGHPGAGFFVANIVLKATVNKLLGKECITYPVKAVLDESVSANQGRAVCIGVRLLWEGHVLHALPIQSKSGLVTTLTQCDGYLCISRDCEGIKKGDTVSVIPF